MGLKNQITIIFSKIWPTNRILKEKSYNFHFHKNDVTWPLSANGLLVLSRTVLTLSVQNGPAWSKLALEKLGPIWPLGSIWLFSFYSEPVVLGRCSMCLNYLFQFCAVAVHAIPNSSSCQHKGLQIRYSLNSGVRKVMR